MPPEEWVASKPGDALREERTRSGAHHRSGSESAQAPADGTRDAPVRRLRRPTLTGLAPNVTFGSGVGTGRPGFGVGNRAARHPDYVVPRLRGRWTCPVHRPASGGAPVAVAAKGARSGAWVAND